MLVGQRIRQLREQKGLSQVDLQKASGLRTSYISRVDHGHIVPSLETLQKFATGLDLPLYRLFYEGEEPPPTPHLTPRRTLEELAEELAIGGLRAKFLRKFRKLLSRMTESDRTFLLEVAKKLAIRWKAGSPAGANGLT
jgi:transcriptional regulator with XRE-family HTH domain